MKIELSTRARKQFLKLSQDNQQKVARKIDILSVDPFMGKKLSGKFQSLYSLRAWPYRIIYQINKKVNIIYLVAIEHRQGVYK